MDLRLRGAIFFVPVCDSDFTFKLSSKKMFNASEFFQQIILQQTQHEKLLEFKYVSVVL